MRTVLLLTALAFLTACGTMPGLGGTAGAPQTSANVAQTARDQSSLPGQAYGGDNMFNFASSTPGEVTLALIQFATDTGAPLSDLTEALKATNGAPETVNITTRDIAAGNGENLGSAAGSASNAGAGGVTR
jgi:hypothetical protein